MLDNSAIANDVLYVIGVETPLYHSFLGMGKNRNVAFIP